MRYAFILNPNSGRGNHGSNTMHDVEQLIANHIDEDIGIYKTTGYRDAAYLADTIASEAMKAGDDIVVFACGGDGTVHEIANSIYGYDNAILGVVPIGSGNDFVRALSKGKRNYKDYLDLEKQMTGSPKDIDVIEIRWEEDGEEKSCIAVNGVNIGFDGDTAIKAGELIENTVLSGSFAYLVAVFSTLTKKDGQRLCIKADGEAFHDGKLLLTTMGNGNYCGGGIESCPRAVLDDGMIELLAIKDMSKMSFIRKFPGFSAGKLFELKNIDKIAVYKQAREVSIEPLKSDTMKYVIDGEIYTTPEIKAEVRPGALAVWEI